MSCSSATRHDGDSVSRRDRRTSFTRSPSADFSALAPEVYISDAFHDATISIDEEGTVAAAATAFVGVGVSQPIDPPTPVIFNRPFVFFVRDIQTNALLFVGHYANP